MVIYKTTNLINNKFYIGQDSKNNTNYFGSGKYLKNAINKYGKKNFKKEILEYCKTQEELNQKEIYWIEKLKPDYNIAKGGNFILYKGQTYQEVFGKREKEIKQKIKDSLKGHKVSEKTKEKISKSLIGKKHDKKRIEKNRIGHLGIKKSEESIKKMIKTRRKNNNYKCSEETKEKIRKTLKKRWKDGRGKNQRSK